MARTGVLSLIAGETGRFFGDGLTWAMAQPLPVLIHWHEVMLHLRGD
jgi:hypothetical protein